MRPEKMEFSILLGWMFAGVLLQSDAKVQGMLAGLALALLVWAIFVVIVGVSNYGFLPRHQRAPAMGCVVAPFTTGFALLLMGRWPGSRNV